MMYATMVLDCNVANSLASLRRNIRLGFLIVSVLLLICAIANLALLIKRVGWASRKRNARVFTHIINSILLVVGMHMHRTDC
jgi:hypothetical protein